MEKKENKKEKIAINDELLDKIAGGEGWRFMGHCDLCGAEG